MALGVILVLSACGGSSEPAANAHGTVNGHAVQDLYGSLPTAGTPVGTGTITMGQLTGDTPTYIFPIVPGSQATDGTAFLIDQLYVPLYNVQVGGTLTVNYATSAAEKPTFSDGDRRVTIRLRPGLTWSDGQPVTSTDVLFYIALLRAAVKESADNWELYTPGLLPDNIAGATAPNPRALVLTFTKTYNPNYLLGDQLAGTLTPLPSSVWNVDAANGPHLTDWQSPAVAKKIYDYLSKQGASIATLASDPLWHTVDGPFRLTSFSPTNSSFTLQANPRYALTGKVRFSTLNVETFAGTFSQLNALRAGTLEVAAIDFSQLNEVPGLRSDGFSVYGYPNIGSFGVILNFRDGTDHFDRVIGQLYARQALAHLVDQPGYIAAVFKGAASTAYGPLPTVPKTPFTPAAAGVDPYPYSASAAAALLKAHGWKVVPYGQTTCAKPGTGSGECGAGIPAGRPFRFTLYDTPPSSSESIPLESEAFSSAAKQVGIEITLGVRSFNYQISNFNDSDPGDDHFRNDWGAANWGEYGTTPYPTEETIFNTAGSSNFGGYSDPTADALINRALYDDAPSAATAVASYLERSVPMLFLPCADVLDAVSTKVGGTADSFLAMTQDVFYPQYWYLKR